MGSYQNVVWTLFLSSCYRVCYESYCMCVTIQSWWQTVRRVCMKEAEMWFQWWSPNKKLSHHRETARCFMSLNISLSHSSSLENIQNDPQSKACLVNYKYVCSSYRFWDTERQIIPWPNGTIRKTGCSLLCTFHNNYGSVLYHFRDKARCESKIAIFSYPLHSSPVIGSLSGSFKIVVNGTIRQIA